MSNVHIAGTGMTPFAKHPNEDIRSLSTAAVSAALADAGLGSKDIGLVFFANAAAGLISGQEMIRGQAALRHTGLLGIPIVNVENACASASTALMLAVTAINAGVTDVAIAVGAEKLSHPDKQRSFDAIGSATDLFELEAIVADLGGTVGVGGSRSVFMDVYAAEARRYMARTDATAADLAAITVKSRAHAALNPKAQFRVPMTVEGVLTSRVIADPLTLPMCSPIGDGAAAVVVVSEERARRLDRSGVRILASALVSGRDAGHDADSTVIRAAAEAYEQAGVEPGDVDVIELHDAAASAELIVVEELGLASPGEGVKLLRSGATTLGGACVVNPSGGLLSRGHPIGATGLAQVVELTDQLRGRAGQRQVDGARLALAENAGGWLGSDNAATTVTILSAS